MKILKLLPLACTIILGAASCSDDDKEQTGFQIDDGSGFLSLDAAARSGSIAITANNSWSVTQDKDSEWLTLSTTSGAAGRTEIGIMLEANPGEARNAGLTFNSGGRTYPFVITQSAHVTADFDDADHCFYITFGTLPTLYAGLHVLSHDKPSYVFFQRSQTFRPEEFPAHAEVTIAADPSANATDEDMERMRTAMKQQILKINVEDPTAVFGLYVDDLRCGIGYDWFVAQGIDSTRVKVSMLSDGTGTYNNFYNYFGDPATAEQNWENYAAQVEALDWQHGGRFPETRMPDGFDFYEWPYYLATRPNYRLVLQDDDLLEATSPFMTERLQQMRTESKQPYELLASLPAEARQRFFRMAGFDYDAFAALFDASPKKNLVIIGTSHTSEESEAQQAAYVERIIGDYGTAYDIFFKPHPADSSSSNYEERFEGLTLLPGQMPFEIFVWSLLDKVDLIGGYSSTVFLTVPVEKTGFIFAANAESLPRPLNVLFRNAEHVRVDPVTEDTSLNDENGNTRQVSPFSFPPVLLHTVPPTRSRTKKLRPKAEYQANNR